MDEGMEMKTAAEYIAELETAAAEFALSTPANTKSGLIVRKDDETGLIIWAGLKEPVASLQALMQNGGQPIGFIGVSLDESSGKLKVWSSLLEEYGSDAAAGYTLSRICENWSLQ
jgi:hypothetical protein